VVFGHPKVGDLAIATVDAARRHDIMRNHTATHLLHAALHQVLGQNARQAGSLVAPDRFRFDFNHPEALTPAQVERVEKLVNEAVAADYPVTPASKSRQQAVTEGTMALFGEKYGDTVRTITVGEKYSYELCGGTHLERTSDVGAFLIVSESSAAAGVRRIEAVTGRGAYELVAKRFKMLKQTAATLKSAVDEVPQKTQTLVEEISEAKKQIAALHQKLAFSEFTVQLENVEMVSGVPVLAARLPNADAGTLRLMVDEFKQRYTGGTILLGSVVDDKPIIVTGSYVDPRYDYNAIDVAKIAAEPLGGSGGGRPNLAQAGGKYPERLNEALDKAKKWIRSRLKEKGS
jgi:alanyl-tRNA synthetase